MAGAGCRVRRGLQGFDGVCAFISRPMFRAYGAFMRGGAREVFRVR